MKKNEWYKKIDQIKNDDENISFSLLCDALINICKDVELNELDTKDLVIEIGELL